MSSTDHIGDRNAAVSPSSTGESCDDWRELCTDTNLNLNFTRSGTSSHWRSTCISCLNLRLNFLVSLTRRAAAFKRRWNLSIVAFGAPASSTLHDARSNEGMDQRRRWLWIQWLPDTSQLPEPIKTDREYLRDVLIHGQIWWQCHSEHSNVVAGNNCIYSEL